jgi:hypothetical protein
MDSLQYWSSRLVIDAQKKPSFPIVTSDKVLRKGIYQMSFFIVTKSFLSGLSESHLVFTLNIRGTAPDVFDRESLGPPVQSIGAGRNLLTCLIELARAPVPKVDGRSAENF